MRTLPVEALAAGIRAGSRPIAVLAGAGVSGSAGVMTGHDLLVRIARERGEDPGPDPVVWYLTTAGGFPDYFGMVQDEPGADTLPAELYERPAPTPAHRAIAELIGAGWVGPVLTTNVDRLLELALDQAGLPVETCFDLDAMGRVTFAEPVLIKLHGDYRDIGIRRTARVLHTYHPVIDALLDHVFADFDLLVCGWSASWDVPLCDALHRAGKRRIFWLQCGPPSQAAQRIFESLAPMVSTVPSPDAGLTTLATALRNRSS